MIGRMPISARSTSSADTSAADAGCVYIPLLYIDEDHVWRPLSEGEAYESAMDAATAALRGIHKPWATILGEIRTLRALCEHPNLRDFVEDGIDGKLLGDRMRHLAALAGALEGNMARLLDEPEVDDEVVIGGVAHQVDDASGLLRPLPPPEADLQEGSEEDVFARALMACLAQVRVAIGRPISAVEIHRAIAYLQRLLQERDETAPRAGTDTDAEAP